MKTKTVLLFILSSLFVFHQAAKAQLDKPVLRYIVSMPQPASHRFHIEFQASGLNQDTLLIKIPNWMPGYYQLMDYAKNVENISARNANGENIPLNKMNGNTWSITSNIDKSLILNYDVKSERQFVANSFLDSTHAYIVPANNFLYRRIA